MIHTCQYCNQQFSSEKKLYSHMAIFEDSFKDGSPIAEAIIKSLQKTQDRTLFLLVRFPETRIPHEEGYLFNKYLQYFVGTLIWDVAQQGFTSRDNKAIPYKTMAWALKQLNSVSRARRLLQHKERAKKKAGEPYLDILPSDEAQSIAMVSEKAHKAYYTADGEIGHTFRPNGGI